MFDGITNEAEGLQGILHARKRTNIRDMVMITYTSKGRTSFVQLDWKKPR